MRKQTMLLAVLGVSITALGGCARSKVAQTLDSTFEAKTEASDQEFWHSLPGRSAVTNSEGLHGVLMLSDGTDPTGSWDERLALLRERGWVVEGFAGAGDETISRGTLAKALCHALKVKGGVMMQLTHTMPRYAVRELAYLRIMASSTENQVVNGLDYLGILSKAQDYAMLLETKAARKAAGDAPADEDAAPATEPAPESSAEPAGTPS